MSFDVTGYLQSKGLEIKPATGSNIHTHCFYCDEDPSKRGRLYVDVDPEAEPLALHTCFKCGTSGALNKIRKHFGDPLIDASEMPSVVHSEEVAALLEDATAFCQERLRDNPERFQWLLDVRGLTADTVERFRLGYDDGTMVRHLVRQCGYKIGQLQEAGLADMSGKDFLANCITIPYMSVGNVVMLRGRYLGDTDGRKYLTPKGNKARLFNADALLSDPDSVTICEGEFDAIILEQYGFCAVAVPGATNWSERWNSKFSSVQKIFVAFDSDQAGHNGSEKVVRNLPSARIVRVSEINDGTDITDFFVRDNHNADDFRFLQIRAVGGNLVTVHDGYKEWQEVQSEEGLKFGIEVLDSKLAPGLLPGQVFIYLAKSNAGKTIMMLNLFERMLWADPEVRILFCSLEQTAGDWFERARRIHRFYNPDLKDESVLSYFENNLMLIEKNRLREEELLDSLDQYEFEMGAKPDLVAIDYLGYWAKAYRGEEYERLSSAVMALKAIAKERRISFLVPHQVSRRERYGEEIEADSARGSGVVEESADFICSLWTTDQRKGTREDQRTGKVNMKLVKSRHGNVGAQFSFQFAPLSLAMVPQAEQKNLRKALAEMEWNLQQDSFETAIYRHATGDMDYPVDDKSFEMWKSTLQ